MYVAVLIVKMVKVYVLDIDKVSALSFLVLWYGNLSYCVSGIQKEAAVWRFILKICFQAHLLVN